MQQWAARRSWFAWLDENTTAAAKVHQLIREPIGFQTASGNVVDEQLKLGETWAAIWRANAVEPALVWPEDNGPLFHRPSVNELPLRGSRPGLTSSRSLKRNTNGPPCAIGSSLLRRRAGDPSACCSPSCVSVQASANRGQDWEARNTEGFFCARRCLRRAVCLGAGSIE